MHTYLISFLIFLSSCASILSGTTEKIYVRSEVPGTKLYLDKTEIGTDEASVVVSKKRLKKVKLHAKKEGCESVSMGIPTRFNKLTLLGIFVDLGIASILIFDWGTYGAVNEAEKLNFVLSPVCK